MACSIVVTRPFAQLGRTILDFLFLARCRAESASNTSYIYGKPRKGLGTRLLSVKVISPLPAPNTQLTLFACKPLPFHFNAPMHAV